MKLSFIFCFLLSFLINTNAQLFINEIISSNDITIQDNYGEYDDVIEIYNAGSTPVNLSGYFISDDVNNLMLWQIPSTNPSLTNVPANGYLLLWADANPIQGANHLNFKLSQSGETIYLVQPNGISLIDSLNFPVLANDFSYGRLPDGSANATIFATPSPATSNNNSLPELENPVISPASGVYAGSQTVSILGTAGVTIYYTTDGSEPNAFSNVYNNPFNISSTQSVRAIAVRTGYNNSFITTNTYLIGYNPALPVFYISTNPDNLYDDNTGIYVEGTNGLAGYCNLVNPYNWNQDWERPAHLKVFKDGNMVAENNIGIKISGNCKRLKPQKPLTLFFRDEYSDTGDNEFNYQIFPTNKLDKFKRLFVRSGNNFIPELNKDLVIARMLENKLDIDLQSGQPAIIFLNDQYMGIQNIREKYDKWHFANDHKKVKEKNNIDILKTPGRYGPVEKWWALHRATNGDTLEWRILMNEIRQKDYSIPNNYETLEQQIDINGIINYLTTGHFFCNQDWIPTNQKTWKEQGRGKWRWCLLDFDTGLNINNVALNTLSVRILRNSPTHSKVYETNIIYRKLFSNEEFKFEYIQRMNTYLETLFTSSKFNSVADDYYNEILPELPDAMSLYGQNLTAFQTELQNQKNFVAQRKNYVAQHMESEFGISGTFELSVNVNSNSGGKVALHSNYYELPYNYAGTYYQNIPFHMHAIPKPGYRFVEWVGINGADKYKSSVYTSFYPASGTKIIRPVFELAAPIVINEIHYHPSDTINNKEFIEIYNPDDKPFDLSNYQFSKGVCFQFPEGTIINADEYIILADDATQYSGNGYRVFQWDESKLSNDGESLVLNNPVGYAIDSVKYNDNTPWPLLADGTGSSLALFNNSDNSLPANWAIQPSQVTPGAINQFCAPINNNATIANVSCSGVNDGFVLTQISGGTSPYTYSWSNGVTNSINNNLPPGQYTVTVTDFYNCTFVETFNLSAPAPLSANTIITDASSNTVGDGSVNLTANGGTPPYSYTWSTAATTEDISGLMPGSYWVNVIDANNCQLLINNIAVESSCVISIVQQNQPVLTSSVYQVADFILSNGTVNLNEQVSFKAGDYIELNNDFEVIQGATFEALIEGCQ